MTLRTTIRDRDLQRDLKRWNNKPINTKAVLQRAATTYPETVFRDQDSQVALTLPGDTSGDIIQATIKSYIPIDGYVVSIVRLVGYNDATESLARNCKTWTVDTIAEAKQWLTNHGLDIDAYETIDITER